MAYNPVTGARHLRDIGNTLRHADRERIHDSPAVAQAGAQSDNGQADNGIIPHGYGDSDENRNKREHFLKYADG